MNDFPTKDSGEKTGSDSPTCPEKEKRRPISHETGTGTVENSELEKYTTVLQALISSQERIDNYRSLVSELTAMLEKVESLNSCYLSFILAHEKLEYQKELPQRARADK